MQFYFIIFIIYLSNLYAHVGHQLTTPSPLMIPSSYKQFSVRFLYKLITQSYSLKFFSCFLSIILLYKTNL